ncbi:hydroxyphenylacetyl-CoA thioesterase PaaI [Sulfitobacter sp. HNIBRBA2951]|uniref:hydroxyphenylacetyl-CoA thioesterase PaaI n=1 Tax=Sulfitobacter aquimarinus TaxID=3158557 RepID=UPI0032DF81C8
MTPQDRATKSSEALWQGDHAARWLGITVVSVGEGTSVLSLKVEPHHCNGHGMCHGGITFALADTAFAYACNSRNQATVAQHNTISFIAPGQVGDVLTATAHEVSLTGRSGIYDIRVTNQDGTVIAEMRGMSRAIKGPLFPE